MHFKRGRGDGKFWIHNRVTRYDQITGKKRRKKRATFWLEPCYCSGPKTGIFFTSNDCLKSPLPPLPLSSVCSVPQNHKGLVVFPLRVFRSRSIFAPISVLAVVKPQTCRQTVRNIFNKRRRVQFETQRTLLAGHIARAITGNIPEDLRVG